MIQSIDLKSFQRFQINKSIYDKREYRGLLLNNELKCLLISDSSTAKSAASMDVHVGTIHEPKHLPGLAHFCEHMLLMGSRKYPDENAYRKFIQDHAGSNTARTGLDNTIFSFDVAPAHFKEALDIFAQFFISPSFHQSSTDRELNAIESEFQHVLPNDGNRISQLNISSCRDDHPYNRFNFGNWQTLKTEPDKININIRDELIKFHSIYYSSNLMCLCLLGKESLNELELYAVEMFSEIENKKISKQKFPNDPYRRDLPALILYAVAVQDIRQMNISWVIPDYRDSYQSNPSKYITYLIGNKCNGSLLSELKRKGWCNNLIAYTEYAAIGFDFFNLILSDLTAEGLENIQDILKLIFQYLNMLRKENIHKWIFDEMNDLGRINFTFKQEDNPINYVQTIAVSMKIYAFEDVLSAKYFRTKYDSDAIKHLLTYLTPEKMKIIVTSKKYQGKTNRFEKWYGTEYKLMTLKKITLENLNQCGLNEKVFRLPEKNVFIPTDLGLVNHLDLSKFPRLIHSTSTTSLWYKEDSKFLLPMANLIIRIRNPNANITPVNTNMCFLFLMLFSDYLSEYLFDMNQAGLNFNSIPNYYGIDLSFSGFNHKMDVLLNKVLEKMASFKIDPERFTTLKDTYKRNLLNTELSQPINQALNYLDLIIQEKGWSSKQLLSTLNNFTMDDLQTFIPKLLTQNIFIESFMYGNLTKKEALEFLRIIEEKLKPTCLNNLKEDYYLLISNNLRQVKLPEHSEFVFLKETNIHEMNAINVYYQCGVNSARNNSLVDLFHQVINEPTFSVLRTKQQLGYTVWSISKNFLGVLGLEILIQSDKSPVLLDEKIETFFSDFIKPAVETMTSEEFKTHVNAVLSKKLLEPTNMTSQCEYYWTEIQSHEYKFDQVTNEVEELTRLNKNDLVDFFNEFIDSNSKSRRKLSVYFYQSKLSAELTKQNIKGTLIQDLNEWRANLEFYPFVEQKQQLLSSEQDL